MEKVKEEAEAAVQKQVEEKRVEEEEEQQRKDKEEEEAAFAQLKARYVFAPIHCTPNDPTRVN